MTPSPTRTEEQPTDTDESRGGSLDDVIPKPVETASSNDSYRLSEDTRISVDGETAKPVASYLAHLLRPSTGFEMPVERATDGTHGIELRLADSPPLKLGEEGYELTVTADHIALRANAAAGLFAGVQTLRQLLPADVESERVVSRPWLVPGGEIRDGPRFSYRGAHLDVARHFFDVDDVKRFIDHLALYKLNHLHLHLTDDQGWRIEIESWPKLTEIGARSAVDGVAGGYFSASAYGEIVDHAQSRFVTIVPEIDVPGHSNAALASYGELAPGDAGPSPYTGTDVGFSALDVDAEITYEFLDDVIAEVAAHTPGPYLHLGGDEAHELSADDYETFFERAIPIVEKYGKRPIGWHEILGAKPPSSTVIQYWSPYRTVEDLDIASAAEAGHEFVLSPADHAYLDMKYHAETDLGLDWTGYTTVEDAYAWDPGSYVDGLAASAVMGVEAALWSETLASFDDVEFMLFPRLPAIAERGWTPTNRVGWPDFRRRLGRHGRRWNRLDIAFYRSPAIPWDDASP